MRFLLLICFGLIGCNPYDGVNYNQPIPTLGEHVTIKAEGIEGTIIMANNKFVDIQEADGRVVRKIRFLLDYPREGRNGVSSAPPFHMP